MPERISQATIRRLAAKPPSTGNIVVWDSGPSCVTGFGARVTAAGAVSFVLRYVVDGRERRITIGKHPDLTVAVARDEAAKLRGRVTTGDDPLAEREARHKAPTVAKVCDRYVKEHLKVHNKPRTQDEFERLVEKRIKPELGHHKIAALSRADIKAWHHDMRHRPTEANRSLAVLRKILSLASVDWELRDDNPAKSIKLFPETKREVVLSDDQLTKLGETVSAMVAAGDIRAGVGDAIWLLATTGCRVSEVLGLRWDDVDTGTMTLAIRDAKAGARDHTIGATIAARLSEMGRRGPWVCWGDDPAEPLSVGVLDYEWAKVRKRAGLTGIRLHDLRHGYGTEAGNTGANAFQVRDALGHKTLAMTGRYVNKAGTAGQRLANTVAGRLDAVWAGKPAGELVPLPGRMEDAG